LSHPLSSIDLDFTVTFSILFDSLQRLVYPTTIISSKRSHLVKTAYTMHRTAAYFINASRHQAGQCETPPPPPTGDSPRSTLGDESLCSESVSFFLEQPKVPNNESPRLIRPIKTYPLTPGSPRTFEHADYPSPHHHEYHHSPVMTDGYYMRSDQYPDYHDHWSPTRHDSVPWNGHDYQPFYPSSASAHESLVDGESPVDPSGFDGPVPSREDYHHYHRQQQQLHQLHRRPERFYDPMPWKQPRMNDDWHYSVYSDELDDDAGLDFSRPSCVDVKLVMIEEEDVHRRSYHSGTPRRMLKANLNGVLQKARVRELPSNYASIFRSKEDSKASPRQDEDRKESCGDDRAANETIVSSESTSRSSAVRRGHERSDQDDRRYCLSPITTIDPDEATTTELLQPGNEGSDGPDKTEKFDVEGTLFACVDNFFGLVEQFTNCNSPGGNTTLFDDEDDALLRDCIKAVLNSSESRTNSNSCMKKAADDLNEDRCLKNQGNVDYLKIMTSLKDNVQLCPGWTPNERELRPVAPVANVSSRRLVADSSMRAPHSGEKIGFKQLENASCANVVELDDEDDSFLNSAGSVSMFIQAASSE
jgi:hypothetical protein